jgi:Ca-activated chloride channel family protein
MLNSNWISQTVHTASALAIGALHVVLTALILGALACPARAADEPPVSLTADLAQGVLKTGESATTYLRISLSGATSQNTAARTPANIALVIDRSGSMRGERIAQAREAAKLALGRMRPGDFAALVVFNNQIDVPIKAGPADDMADFAAIIDQLNAMGTTALYGGVAEGIDQVRRFLEPYRVNRVILLSDGQANVGPSSPREIAGLGREAASEGISITTIGLGLDYHEDLMSQLALASDGNHAFVEHPDDLVEIFDLEFGDVLSVVAQNASIQITFPEGIRPLRALGREALIEGQTARLDLRQIYAGQEKYLLLEVEIDASAAQGEREAAHVTAEFVDTLSRQPQRIEARPLLAFSGDAAQIEAARNPKVLAAAAAQIATSRSELAVTLRDSGKMDEAEALLRDNAAYLANQASILAAPELGVMAQENLDDAASVSGADWDRQRKDMRARQHRGKTQQAY